MGKAIVIEAPKEVYSVQNSKNVSVFLAGGITNCPDWQSGLIRFLQSTDITIYNPRRANFPMDDPKAAEEQITWEYNHLRDADIISFWFSKGSLNPIVLYELGMWGNSDERVIVIGIEDGYERAQDVKIQTALARPDVEICHSLAEMSSQIQFLASGIEEIRNNYIITIDE